MVKKCILQSIGYRRMYMRWFMRYAYSVHRMHNKQLAKMNMKEGNESSEEWLGDVMHAFARDHHTKLYIAQLTLIGFHHYFPHCEIA